MGLKRDFLGVCLGLFMISSLLIFSLLFLLGVDTIDRNYLRTEYYVAKQVKDARAARLIYKNAKEYFERYPDGKYLDLVAKKLLNCLMDESLHQSFTSSYNKGDLSWIFNKIGLNTLDDSSDSLKNSQDYIALWTDKTLHKKNKFYLLLEKRSSDKDKPAYYYDKIKLISKLHEYSNEFAQYPNLRDSLANKAYELTKESNTIAAWQHYNSLFSGKDLRDAEIHLQSIKEEPIK